MRIKMITIQAGPEGTREPGQVIDVPDAEARQLIEGGYAVEFKRQESAERAVRVAAEEPAARQGRRGRLVRDEKESADE